MRRLLLTFRSRAPFAYCTRIVGVAPPVGRQRVPNARLPIEGVRAAARTAPGAPLARLPGFLLSRQAAHIGGKLARGDVGDGHVLEHLAQVRAQRYPDRLQRLGGTRVFDLLGPLAADSDERSLDRADDLREVDL